MSNQVIELYLGRLPGESAEAKEDRAWDAIDAYTKRIDRKLKVDRAHKDDVRFAVADMIQRVHEEMGEKARRSKKAGMVVLTRLDPNRIAQRGDVRYSSAGLAKIVRGGHDLTPILVGSSGDDYWILDGHHRLRAYQMAKKPVPALVGRLVEGPKKTVYLTTEKTNRTMPNPKKKTTKKKASKKKATKKKAAKRGKIRWKKFADDYYTSQVFRLPKGRDFKIVAQKVGKGRYILWSMAGKGGAYPNTDYAYYNSKGYPLKKVKADAQKMLDAGVYSEGGKTPIPEDLFDAKDKFISQNPSSNPKKMSAKQKMGAKVKGTEGLSFFEEEGDGEELEYAPRSRKAKTEIPPGMKITRLPPGAAHGALPLSWNPKKKKKTTKKGVKKRSNPTRRTGYRRMTPKQRMELRDLHTRLRKLRAPTVWLTEYLKEDTRSIAPTGMPRPSLRELLRNQWGDIMAAHMDEPWMSHERQAEEIEKTMTRLGYRIDDSPKRINPKKKTTKKRNPAPPQFDRGSARMQVGVGTPPKIGGKTIDQKIADLKREFKRAGIDLHDTSILRYDEYHKMGYTPYAPINILTDGMISTIMLTGDYMDEFEDAFDRVGLWYEPSNHWNIQVYPKGTKDEQKWNDFLDAFEAKYGVGKRRNPKKKTAKKKAAKKAPQRKGQTALSLIANCQRKWESYRVKPSKKRLKDVFDHLEKMKASKSAKVKAERRRCLRVANLEAKDLGLVLRNSNPVPKIDRKTFDSLRLAFNFELEEGDPRLLRLRKMGLVEPAPSFEITQKGEDILAAELGDDLAEPF